MTQLLIKLSIKQTEKTSCGEDLFLIVEAFASGGYLPEVEETLKSCDLIVLDQAFDEAWDVAMTNLPLFHEGMPSNEDVYGVDLFLEDEAFGTTRFRSQPTNLGFQIDWTLREAKSKVKKAVIEGDWLKRIKNGTVFMKTEILIESSC